MHADQICQILLDHFQVRKTVAQKEAFANWVCAYAQSLGLLMRTERSGRWVDTRNLIVGDVDRANVLITAHYDTCARLPFPNVITPQCWPILLVTQILLPVLAFTCLGFIGGYCTGKLLLHGDASGIWRLLAACGASLVAIGLIAGLLYLMLAGPANPHTANDNTSGTALVLLCMQQFAKRKDVAFVLFDNEEKGLLGSSAFASAHPAAAKRAFVVNLDCVGDGDTLLFTGSKAAMKCATAKRIAAILEECAAQHGMRSCSGAFPGTLYPSDQMVFTRGSAFAALKGRRILYIDRIHTPADTQLQTRNLLCLLDVLSHALA